MSDSQSMHARHRHPAFWGLRIAGFVVLGVVGAAIFALVFGWLVMLLWNWLMPELFHVVTIGYWQAFGIIILAKLIFGSLGGGGRHGPGRRPGSWKRHGPWDEEWEGGKDRWRYYHDYWREEGRQAFEAYAERKRAKGSSPDTEKA